MNLYIIAGVKGCGKSTFIDYCLRNKINPFFEENCFLSFNPHPYSLNDEWKINTQSLLENQNIISLINFNYIDKNNPPENLLVHFDLLNIHIDNKELDFKTREDADNFTNLNYVKKYYKEVPSLIDQILNFYENIYLMTMNIETEYHKKLYLLRSKRINRKLFYAENYCFKSKKGKNIINNFNEAWIEFLLGFKHKITEHILISFDESHDFYTINNFEITKNKNINHPF